MLIALTVEELTSVTMYSVTQLSAELSQTLKLRYSLIALVL